MRISRLHQGRHWPAHVNSDGKFELADPRFGNTRHHSANKVLASTEDEAISLIRQGHSIRMKTASAPSLVRSNLYIDGVKVT